MWFKTLIRRFCDAAMTKPPIKVYGIEGRYATALYSAASKRGALDPAERDLIRVQSELKTNRKFADFVLDPTIKRVIKAAALVEIANVMSLSPEVTNFLRLIAENGRLKRLNATANSFRLLMSAHRGEVRCLVATAKELEPAQLERLKSALQRFLQPNETLQLTLKVEPELMGGMVVNIGDRYVDMSVANKIRKYTDIIKQSV